MSASITVRSFGQIGLCLLLVLGLIGCNDAITPTRPVDSALSEAQGAEQLVNCYVGHGYGNAFGIYKDIQGFKVNVPRGDYRIRYMTTWGTYYLVFRALDVSLISIGLLEGDEVLEVDVVEGDIDDGDLVDAEEFGGPVLMLVWPGRAHPKPWFSVFVVRLGAIPVFLIRDGLIVLDDPNVEALEDDTVYPIPDVLRVDPSGNNSSHCGIKSSPCKTIWRAVQVACKYDIETILVNPGVYFEHGREGFSCSNNLTIEADGEAIIAENSLVIGSSGNTTLVGFTMYSTTNSHLVLLGSGNVTMVGNALSGRTGLPSIDCIGSGNLTGDGTNSTDGTDTCGLGTPGNF